MKRQKPPKRYRGRVPIHRPGSFMINRKKAENKARGRKRIEPDD